MDLALEIKKAVNDGRFMASNHMDLDFLDKEHSERIVEWVTGGPYAVAVEVDAIIRPDRLDAPYLTPETIRNLERIGKLAEAGDLTALRQEGTVYLRLDYVVSLVTGRLGTTRTEKEDAAARAVGLPVEAHNALGESLGTLSPHKTER